MSKFQQENTKQRKHWKVYWQYWSDYMFICIALVEHYKKHNNLIYHSLVGIFAFIELQHHFSEPEVLSSNWQWEFVLF